MPWRRKRSQTMRALALVGLALLGFLAARAQAATRLAVIASEPDRNLAALLSTKLSQAPGIQLVEREELRRLAAERGLRDLASHGDFSQAGALLNANGLVLLTRDDQTKPPMAAARLVAVNPGVVIDTFAFPVSENPEADAAAVATRFGPLLKKLRDGHAGKAAALSLLGLKFDIGTLAAKTTESQLNRLLADRLIHEPGLFVLERWRMETLAWEKCLAAAPAPFWTGSCLLEGTLHLQGKTLTVSARLKKADASEAEIRLTGTEEDLPALADELTAKLMAELGSKGAPLPWDKTAEAANYLRLAQWALDNQLPADAVAAIESAVALGLAGPKAEVVHIRAYSMLAYPDTLLVGNHTYSPAHFKTETLPQNVEAATEAVRLLERFTQKYSAAPEPVMFTLEHPHNLAPRALMSAYRVLRGAYEHQTHLARPGEVAALRAAVRRAGSLLPGGTPERPPLSTESVLYAPYWTETPAQTLAVYREALQAPLSAPTEWGFPEYLRSEWSREPRHFPYLDTPQIPPTQTPWLTAWQPGEEAKLPEVWRLFVEGLKASPSPQAQIDGWMFDYLSREHRQALLAPIGALLWSRRAELFGPGSRLKMAGMERAVRDTRSSMAPAAARPFPLKLLGYLLETHGQADWLTWSQFLDMNRAWTDEEATVLDPLLTEYEHRLSSSPQRRDQGLLSRLTGFHDIILRQHPGLAPKETRPAGEITVGRYWNMFSREPLQTLPKDLYIEQPGWIDGRLWFIIGWARRVCAVDPQTHELVTFQWPETPEATVPRFGRAGRSLEVTPEALFLADGADVLRCERASDQWKRLDLPPSFYQVRAHAGALYLAYPQTEQWNPTVGSGLLKLDGAAYEVLFSSRRTPPVSPLDGQASNKPRAVFEDRKGNVYFWWLDNTVVKRPGYICESQFYRWSAARKNWEKDFFVSRRVQFKDERPGALIMTEGIRGDSMSFGNFDQLVLLNPDSGQFELLLENPAAQQHPLAQAPRWDFPPELCREAPGTNRRHEMAWHDGTLWVIGYDSKFSEWSGSNHVLFAFRPGGKTALQVPLRFEVPQADRQGLKGPFGLSDFAGSIERPALNPGGVFATASGLVFTAQLTPGFWFLPYSDIPGLSPATAK